MKKSYLLLPVWLSFFLCSCSMSVKEVMNVYDQDAASGDFRRSLQILEERIAKDKSNTHEDTLLWRFLTANALLLTGKNPEAIREFDRAEDLFLSQERSLQVGSTAKSMLVNESYQNFYANGQYRMFCSMYKALAYGAQNNKTAARTEFNRMMEYQENWLFQCRNQIASSEKRMGSELAGNKDSAKNNVQGNARDIFGRPHFASLLLKHCSFDPSGSGDLKKLAPADYQNAYFTHLCGVFRWLNGDNGSVFLRDAKRLKPQNRILAEDHSLAAAGKVPRNGVWIYVEDGVSQVRREARMDLPLFLIPYARRYILYAGMALPALEERSVASRSYTVTAGRVTCNMVELENMDRLLRTEYDVYMRGAVPRELARCLLKTLPQIAAGIAADHTSDSGVYVAMRAAQASAASYAAASTRADLRSWRSLPKRVLVARVKRPADGKILLTYDNGKLLIELPEGNSILWFRKTGPLAPVVRNWIHFGEKMGK